jgi:hypothetical protein
MTAKYNMTGRLQKNDRKASDKHPDIKGFCTIDDKPYWISGWRNTERGGYDLKFKVRVPKGEPKPARSAPPLSAGDYGAQPEEEAPRDDEPKRPF